MVGASTSVASSVSTPFDQSSQVAKCCHADLTWNCVQSGRFTDDPIHDPYSATRGLWFAHCGWIFRRPNYPRLKLIEKDDLEDDIGSSDFLQTNCDLP